MAISPFGPAHIEEICNILADTNTGLTGAEIGRILKQLNIDDPGSGMSNKRSRLQQALSDRQSRDHSGNHVASFIQEAMNPVRYRANPGSFHERRTQLNVVLAFVGIGMGEDGRLRAANPAKTLTEAQERAGRLRAELIRRNVHGDVLAFCRAELLVDDYFHAVFEAMKSIADKIRSKANLTQDGAELIDQAFAGPRPRLAINSLVSEPEQSEQRGFTNLVKGAFGTFRNTTAHAPRIHWHVGEQDAMDLLSLASYLHRRLDEAVRTPW